MITKYKVAYISGDSNQIANSLQRTINEINLNKGEIKEIVQSQSSVSPGYTIVTITIIYTSFY